MAGDYMYIALEKHTNFLATAIVLRMAYNEDYVIPPRIFPHHHRMNAVGNVQALETIFKPWMDKVGSGTKYVFQQDCSFLQSPHNNRMVVRQYDHVTPKL